jgi:hypothetical protein
MAQAAKRRVARTPFLVKQGMSLENLAHGLTGGKFFSIVMRVPATTAFPLIIVGTA